MIRFNMRYGPVLTLLLLLERCACESGGQYFGKELGALSQLHHGVRGRVYAIDSRTLYIRDFHYDGEGPAAYFYVGTSKSPVGGSEGGVRLRDERGGAGPLRRYRGEGITLALPDGKSLKDVKWFSVWCDEFSVNFGDVSVPRDVEYPRPVKVSALRGVHGVSSDPIVVVDAQTLLVPYFSYDGEAPDAKFWVGRGDKPSPQGIRIPDENGKEAPLRRYDRKTIVLTLPGELTVFDIGHFAVWCEAFTVNFGHVTLPRHLLSNVPPSLKMLGVSPQSRNKELSAQHESAPASPAAGRVRARRPLAPLDATTYRPHLRPGPLAALLDSPVDRSPLHRRADSYTPPAQRPLDTPPQQETQSERKDDTDDKDTQQRHVYQDDLQTYRTQSHRRSERPQQTVDRQRPLPERYQQNENYQQQRSQELYYQEPPQYQSQVYQPQYSEQRLLHERLAYERRLLEERYRSQPQPQYELQPQYQPQLQYQPQPQYRLVPYYSQPSKLNCEVLHDELAFEVRWAVAGDSIVVQLVAKLEDGEYMAFGISGHPNKTQMVGGDPGVAWVNKTTLKGYAEDYYLDAKSQCVGDSGSCPDERFVEGTNSIRLLNAALVNGYSIVTYQRSLKAADKLDLPVLTNQSQPIIWAIGPLNSRDEVSYHHHYNKDDKFIEFGRPPVWNCPMPEGEDDHPTAPSMHRQPDHRHRDPNNNHSSQKIRPNPVPTPRPVPKVQPWEIPAIQCYEPPDGVFYAQMGPTGGKQGYSAITGHVGWGISWYINGLLIPEINVIRGKKYTFVVEGGHDPAVPARYHPFYITNDPVGGYQHKTDEEKKGIEIYAGVRRSRSGELIPSGVGRLCNWTPDNEGPEADEYPSFGAYQRSLTLVCEEGNPGVVTWTPDKNTPDTVYYQCYTHRHLGWKINVLDECDAVEAEESRVVETRVLPDDLDSEESVQVHSRVAPENMLDQRKKVEKIINTKNNYYDNFSTISGLTGEVLDQDDRNQFYKEREFELPISNVQIKEVIEAVENIENKMKEEIHRAPTTPKPLNQYQVHEDVKEMFIPEQPIGENEEYIVETGKVPETYFLPPNQKPLTLQSVLRPNGPKPSGNMRPPFRRPAPPEIKMRRPPPMFQKINGGYPLPLPNGHGPHTMQKKPQKFHNNRLPPNMNRPSMGNGQPMKSAPSMYHKPTYHQNPPIHLNAHQQPPKLSNPGPSIVLAKPISGNMQVPLPNKSQTLSLGQTDIIVNQVVKSQITLPGGMDAIAQHSSPQTYLKPGQIILGKPMEHPVPLDQQMIQTKPQFIRTPPTPPPQYFPSTTLRIKLNNEHQIQNDIRSSDFIGESIDSSNVQPALNTGFKPDSIVVESGFKPIIREPLMAAEDRIAEYEGNSNRREDTDVEEDYEESPQTISNHAYNDKIPSDKITETFEPMFIPSPPDHLLPTNDRTKEIFPKNHAKEDRPHPVYVKTESELNALFSRKNMDREVPEMVMESNRVSPHYLPPDPKLPKEHSQKLSSEQTFTTYDGKTVSAATLTSVPDVNKTSSKLFSSKLPANTELLLRSPQFGPFKGEIPPPVVDHIVKDSQVKLSDLNSRTTKLKLVNIHKPAKSFLDDVKADGSEKHEVTVKPDDEYEDKSKKENDDEFKNDDEVSSEEYDEDEESEQVPKNRNRRESKDTQFEKGEVEQVHTNGHTLIIRNQIDFDDKSSASKRLYPITPIVLLTLCLNIL